MKLCTACKQREATQRRNGFSEIKSYCLPCKEARRIKLNSKMQNLIPRYDPEIVAMAKASEARIIARWCK